jgi:aspartyl-tRNA(Asn)/glutamyl-tRNA(Gln) amidotransferase subunit A
MADGDVFDPARASLIELTRALRERSISAVELMTHVLAAIERTGPALGAIVARRPDEALLAEARRAQTRLDGQEARPLEGIPFAAKDLEHAAGLVTSHGSRLFAGRVATQDSTQVARLRAAGAILVGKTNTSEFGATALTKNLVHGTTCSPWDLARSPGGSSGGAAAALAAGVLPLVTAHDGGGSIRVPASCTGAFGLKPTHGRVPTGPDELWDASATIVYGPLTRTVADAALLLDLLAGPDPHDVFSLPAPGFSYLARLEEPQAPLRIAYSRDLGGVPVQSDVAAAVEEAVDVFRALGNQVTVVSGGPPDLGTCWAHLLGSHLDAWIGDEIDARASEVNRGVVALVELARSASPADSRQQARARMEAVRWFAAIFADHDLLLTPTVPFDPPPARGPLPTRVGDVDLPPSGMAAFTLPINLVWIPAATVRAGFSRANLPVGLQIVGPRGSDDRVLQAARRFERERPWHPRWPVL